MEKGGRGAPANIVLKKDEAEDLSGRIHQVPCCVKQDGPASVSDYFKPKLTGVGVDGLPLQQAHFRGRLLQGTSLPLPHGFSGFVLSKKSDECWETSATFRDVTYWNHEFAPSHNDDLFRAFHCLTLSQALHNPVTAEELASSSFSL
ncbi:uncharacterized protein LOC107461116 [Arachis duranensis]|uniref:Uncharacterized protein LOC107461116 n=1 Tax=Arachis duranensis TaxID=130453 RepID=A0A6P4BTW5_ARADU|nr:uncharacterized protein LOC107461116 [Arachis duranensis]